MTAAPVAVNAEAISQKMYTILFSDFPQIKVLFKGADSSLHKKLAVAIATYAKNIENIETLSYTIERITSIHVLKNIQKEHYPMVGSSLLKAIKDVLGDIATDEVLDAWEEAYFFLADILITREKELYAQA
nr:globin domain-containing protein [Sulfurimonas sp. SAG-AH-194-L11]